MSWAFHVKKIFPKIAFPGIRVKRTIAVKI